QPEDLESPALPLELLALIVTTALGPNPSVRLTSTPCAPCACCTRGRTSSASVAVSRRRALSSFRSCARRIPHKPTQSSVDHPSALTRGATGTAVDRNIDHSMIFVTTPAPTVLPPSRIAK